MEGHIYSIEKENGQILLKVAIDIPEIKDNIRDDDGMLFLDWRKRKTEFKESEDYKNQIKAQLDLITSCKLGNVKIEYT